MSTIAPALLLCMPGLTSPRHVAVDIIIHGEAASPAFVAAAIEEAADIWAAYGVEVRTPHAHDAARDRAMRLVVTLGPPPDRMKDTGALGSIVFTDGAPEPSIALYPAAASALVSAVAFNRRDDGWPGGSRDRVLARVLGRALAHEIGHFLLRSREHSAGGLMRAFQSGADLTSPDRRTFALSADEARRFRLALLSIELAE